MPQNAPAMLNQGEKLEKGSIKAVVQAPIATMRKVMTITIIPPLSWVGGPSPKRVRVARSADEATGCIATGRSNRADVPTYKHRPMDEVRRLSQNNTHFTRGST